MQWQVDNVVFVGENAEIIDINSGVPPHTRVYPGEEGKKAFKRFVWQWGTCSPLKRPFIMFAWVDSCGRFHPLE